MLKDKNCVTKKIKKNSRSADTTVEELDLTKFSAEKKFSFTYTAIYMAYTAIYTAKLCMLCIAVYAVYYTYTAILCMLCKLLCKEA